MCRPFQRIRYLDAIEMATTPTKIQMPCKLHHWPCNVPGVRRIKAALFPVSNPLAGHIIALSLKKATPNSIRAPVARQMRICATESRKPSTVCPSTWSVISTAATCIRGSRMLGRMTAYSRPKRRATRRLPLVTRGVTVGRTAPLHRQFPC